MSLDSVFAFPYHNSERNAAVNKEAAAAKKCVPILLLLMCMMMCCSAIGEAALSKKQQPKEKAILSALSSTEYKNWKIYTPADTEIEGKNILSTELYKKGRYFPVVAVKDTSTVLVLLERNGKKWEVAYANPAAIRRDGFLLKSFRIASADFVVDEPSVTVAFTFQSTTNQDTYGLNLNLDNGKTACAFQSFHITQQNYPVKPFSGSIAVYMEADGYTFSYYDDNLMRRVAYKIAADGISTDIQSFDLSVMPLYPQQAMRKAALNQLLSQPIQTMNMYRNPDAADILYTISGEEEIYYAPADSGDSNSVVYLIQYKETLGYIIAEDDIARDAIMN